MAFKHRIVVKNKALKRNNGNYDKSKVLEAPSLFVLTIF